MLRMIRAKHINCSFLKHTVLPERNDLIDHRVVWTCYIILATQEVERFLQYLLRTSCRWRSPLLPTFLCNVVRNETQQTRRLIRQEQD